MQKIAKKYKKKNTENPINLKYPKPKKAILRKSKLEILNKSIIFQEKN